MGDVIQMKKQKKSKTDVPATAPAALAPVVPINQVETKPEVSRPPLRDVVAGFTFSRLPREQRIAQTLANVFSKVIKPSFGDSSVMMNEDFFLAVATELEPYARKDFAVRYGKLDQ